MDKLFEDGIKFFCVDIVLNYFDGLQAWNWATLIIWIV